VSMGSPPENDSDTESSNRCFSDQNGQAQESGKDEPDTSGKAPGTAKWGGPNRRRERRGDEKTFNNAYPLHGRDGKGGAMYGGRENSLQQSLSYAATGRERAI
jgi:hypothetical protein